MVKKLSFSSVEKFKDFVDKRGRLLDDISKKNVCKDIVQLLESNVSALQNTDVITKIKNTFHTAGINSFSMYRYLTQPVDGIPRHTQKTFRKIR